MKDRLERTLSVILVGAALAIAVGMVHREFFAHTEQTPSSRDFGQTYEKNWMDLLASGNPQGDTAAPVKIIEFSDLECPFCRELHKSLGEVLAADPKGVVSYFVHYPTPGHRFAIPAARAAECARSRGRFDQFVALVFEKQDSLGLKSWGSFAHDAGLQDTTAIVKCAIADGEVPRIVENVAAGRKLNIRGTPTVFYNGWRVQGGASTEEIKRIVDRLKKGSPPFATADSANE